MPGAAIAYDTDYPSRCAPRPIRTHSVWPCCRSVGIARVTGAPGDRVQLLQTGSTTRNRGIALTILRRAVCPCCANSRVASGRVTLEYSSHAIGGGGQQWSLTDSGFQNICSPGQHVPA
jgi:hypothetical protein